MKRVVKKSGATDSGVRPTLERARRDSRRTVLRRVLIHSICHDVPTRANAAAEINVQWKTPFVLLRGQTHLPDKVEGVGRA